MFRIMSYRRALLVIVSAASFASIAFLAQSANAQFYWHRTNSDCAEFSRAEVEDSDLYEDYDVSSPISSCGIQISSTHYDYDGYAYGYALTDGTCELNYDDQAIFGWSFIHDLELIFEADRGAVASVARKLDSFWVSDRRNAREFRGYLLQIMSK